MTTGTFLNHKQPEVRGKKKEKLNINEMQKTIKIKIKIMRIKKEGKEKFEGGYIFMSKP